MKGVAIAISLVGLLLCGAAIDRTIIVLAHSRYQYNGIIELPNDGATQWPVAVPTHWPAPDYRITHWENSFVFEDVIAAAEPRGIRFAAATARAGWPLRSYGASSIIEERNGKLALERLSGGADRPMPWLPRRPFFPGLIGNASLWGVLVGTALLVIVKLARLRTVQDPETFARTAGGTAT
jgi:hypothetical protein